MALAVAAFPPRATFGYVAQGILALCLMGWLGCVPLLNNKLLITDAGLEVTNYFVRYRIPWACVDAVKGGDNVTIQLRNGQCIRVAVGAWSLAAQRGGNQLQAKVSGLIQQAQQQAGELDPRSDVRRDLRTHWDVVLAVVVALEVLAYVRVT